MNGRLASWPRAFSLIEIMIASTILLFGIAGIAGGLTNLSRTQEHQRHRALAATVAGNVIEELILQHDDETLVAGVSTGRYDGKGRLDSSGPYAVVRTVVDDNPMAGARRIDVTVNWNERGVAKSHALKTYAYTPDE